MAKYIFFVAHPDDETIGCGGTINKLTNLKNQVKVIFFTKGEGSRDFNNKKTLVNEEKRLLNCRKALKTLGVKLFKFNDYPDNQLYKIDFLNIVKLIELEIKKFKPTYVYTHFSGDLNVDHQIVSKAVTTAVRPAHNNNIKALYYFPTLSSTEWNFYSKERFVGNYYVDISKSIKRKLKAFNFYKSEIKKNYPRSSSAIESQAHLLGSQIGCKYAESFQIGYIKSI